MKYPTINLGYEGRFAASSSRFNYAVASQCVPEFFLIQGRHGSIQLLGKAQNVLERRRYFFYPHSTLMEEPAAL
jgi:hypothetical protein